MENATQELCRPEASVALPSSRAPSRRPGSMPREPVPKCQRTCCTCVRVLPTPVSVYLDLPNERAAHIWYRSCDTCDRHQTTRDFLFRKCLRPNISPSSERVRHALLQIDTDHLWLLRCLDGR